jgi:hypothetical protein
MASHHRDRSFAGQSLSSPSTVSHSTSTHSINIDNILMKLASLVSSVKWQSESVKYHSDKFFADLENKLAVAPVSSKPLWIHLLPGLIDEERGATWARQNIVERMSA